MPKVSVIIPNYNHARYLRQRIDTVLGQTYRDFEVILLDDCSTDESRSIIAEYASNPKIRTEFNEVNSGSTFKQWNKGVRLARGEYVWIAESDDYADEHLLEEIVSRLDSDSDIVLCNCRSRVITSDGKLRGFLDSRIADLDPKRWTEDFCASGPEECTTYLVRCCTVLNASSVVFRKDIYERVGGVDATMRQCGDWKLWAAMALEGKIGHVGRLPLNYFREHDASVTVGNQASAIYETEYLQTVRWILQRVSPTEATRKLLCDGLFQMWYPKVLTNRTPLRRRWQILKCALAVDSRALLKLVRPATVALRMTLSRRYRDWRAKFSTLGRL